MPYHLVWDFANKKSASQYAKLHTSCPYCVINSSSVKGSISARCFKESLTHPPINYLDNP